MTSFVIFSQYSEHSELRVDCTVSKIIEIFTTKKEILFNEDHTTGFQFKMQLSNENNHIDIFYLYQTPTFIDIKLDIQYNENMYSKINSLKRRTVKKLYDHIAIEPHTWHYFTSITDSDIRYHYQTLDGSLKIEFFIKIYRNPRIKNQIPESQLSIDFEKMLQNGPYSDIVVKSVDGQEFNAHKVILASRCEVLKALFDHNTTERRTNVIKSPFVGEVLKEVLVFIYTDKADVVRIPLEILAAADYYQLIRLKSVSEEILIRKLSTENVIETLQLADLHSAEDLKQSSLAFIKRNGLNKIKETEGWAKIESVKLIKCITEYCI